MRKAIIALLSSVLFICSVFAIAENDDLHHLWDLPYGKSTSIIQMSVEANRGIQCEEKHYTAALGLPAYDVLFSTNDQDNYIYGYNFHFEFSELTNSFKLSITVECEWSERCAAVQTVLAGLVEKYGQPDDAAAEFWSEGSNVWIFKKAPSVHEIVTLPVDVAVAADANTILSDWQHVQDNTEMILWTRFNNIRFQGRFNSPASSKTLIEIIFADAKSSLPKPVFEECTEAAPTKEPVSQDGF